MTYAARDILLRITAPFVALMIRHTDTIRRILTWLT
jgi:hypothetical protein